MTIRRKCILGSLLTLEAKFHKLNLVALLQLSHCVTTSSSGLLHCHGAIKQSILRPVKRLPISI